MLSAILIFAIIAGAFAFKARNSFIASVYYTTYTTSCKTTCNLPFLWVTTSTKALFTTPYYYTVTTTSTTSCGCNKCYVTTVAGI